MTWAKINNVIKTIISVHVYAHDFFTQNHICELEGAQEEDLAVYCFGHPLENDMLLKQCTTDQATLDVEVRLLGGKVHGSLARAGKVKGQTPKVSICIGHFNKC